MKGDDDQAIRDYDAALRLKPDMALAFLYRAYAYQRKGDRDRAMKDLSEAFRLDPSLRQRFQPPAPVRKG